MDVLVAALVGEKDAFLRYKCVAAVDRLHHERPDLTFDPGPIETLAWLEGMQFYQFLSYHDNLFVRGGVATPCLLKSLLEEKRARARDRVFLMLALLYPRRDVMAARWDLEHGDGRAKASASEYLDNVLSGPLRRRLMPMLEDLPDDERVTRGNVLLRTRPRDVEETLLILINSEDEGVSATAIDLVGRLELRSLIDDLDHVLAHRDVRDWHVFEAASWTLAGLRLQASKRRALWLEPLPSVEIATRLRAVPIFASVATDELFRIARTGRQVRLDRGHTLYESGSPASHVYLLLDGQVQATCPGRPGRDIRHPAPLGLEDMLEARPHPETVRAIDNSVALQLTFEEALGLLADNTDLVQGLFRWMLDHPAFGTGRLVVRGTADVPREGGSIVDTGPPPDATHPDAALRPIDVVLALRRIPVFARSSVQARLALAAISFEERLEPNGVLVHASDAPSIRVLIEGELEAREPGGDVVTICPGDAIGVLETCAGVPIGANIRVTLPGRALRISHEDFFDLLGQRADLLQSLFATLFGARRAEWDLAQQRTAREAAAEPA
jgi:CRP-like cAMP-binding protein